MGEQPGSRRIGVLHTSLVFIKVEQIINDLLGELLPGTEVMHFVDSDVLATVMREGEISPASAARMHHLAQAAAAADADVIFSVCSSLGPAIDFVRDQLGVPVVKIDEAMAEAAVQQGPRVGVLATVPSTLKPTADLIHEKARHLIADVSVREQLAAGAFDLLMQGQRDAHDAAVTEAAKSLAGEVDVIALAQASMSRLQEPLAAAAGLPVLSSPRLGVEKVRATLDALPH